MIKGASLAIDIDDTLTLTARHTFELAKRELGHNLSVDELLFQYGQPGEVPEWKTPQADAWLEAHLGSAEYLSTVPVVEGAAEILRSLNNKYPIACYITSRQHYTREKTTMWLEKNNFPAAELITRDATTKEVHWKLLALSERFEQPPIIIDDILGELAAEYLLKYPSSLFWFNPLGRVSESSDYLVSVSSWQEVAHLLS